MFTGIVEELGEVVAVELRPDSARITVHGPLVTAGTAHGDSIAVNGICLTVVDVHEGTFTADVMRETLDRSALGALESRSPVNLERAMPAAGRFGGSIVQGHVDATATLIERRRTPDWDVVRISLPAPVARYVVEKGSITVDGISLTVAALDAHSFSVSLIPTTLARTTLGHTQPGDPVNLEVDVLAKYVERLLADRGPAGEGE